MRTVKLVVLINYDELFEGICEKCETSEASKTQLQSEVERLTSELASTRQTVVRLHDR